MTSTPPQKGKRKGRAPKPKKRELTLHCLTMIDPATGLFDIASVRSTRADHVANVLEQTWLSRYPWPE